MSPARTSFVSLVLAATLLACRSADSLDVVELHPAGAPLGAAVHATIGAEGGTLAFADGSISLTVPRGAVDAPTDFAIEEITRTAPHGDGRAYRLSPHGRTFAEPVTIAFAVPAEQLARNALVAAYQDPRGAWVAVRHVGIDRDAGTLTVRTPHFSDWTYAEAFRLTPGEARVKVGEAVELVVESCLYDDYELEDGLVLPALVRTCRPFTLHPLVHAASVNGVRGGNGAVGAVTKSGASLVYLAPASVPDANPVAVSAAIEILGRTTKLLVVASVTVVGDDENGDYEGEATSNNEGFVLEAQVTWTRTEDHGEVVAYRPSGTVTATVPGCTVSPATAAIAPEDGLLEIDFSFDPPRYYGGGATFWDATLHCPDSPPSPYLAGGSWWTAQPVAASADGSILEGSYEWWSWGFHAR